MRYFKIRRGNERLWVADLGESQGGRTVRCDSQPVGTEGPKFRDIFTIPPDEEILEMVVIPTRSLLRVVK